ncbi:ATP-binding protein [Rhodococcus sp. JS3073]|uniref:ATP-binding protein n=1 Tax=Rhodococcus sp. JS3073 TaxID=3002901 RepID=UPI002285C619|nr:hypothetical protein [Rhodococcus sp. JS3073]WAM19401.1 hypothetical protein OYT95_43795 [Rhodococcus sp. JS3073]
MFAERASMAVPGFDLTEENGLVVAEICRRLDGLPLPIELAAARLRALSVDQVLHQLTNRFRLLTTGSRVDPQRHQSLRGCIDWSHNLCTRDERSVWAAVSVFSDGFELDAAEMITAEELSPFELLNVVASLVDKSILTVERTDNVVRYRLPQTLRDYGLDRLQEAGKYTRLQQRHRDWFMKQALRADAYWNSPQQRQWIRTLDVEQQHLRDAMTYCFDNDDGRAGGLRIANALSRFWILRGLLSEGRYWLARARAHQSEKSTRAHVRAICTGSHARPGTR